MGILGSLGRRLVRGTVGRLPLRERLVVTLVIMSTAPLAWPLAVASDLGGAAGLAGLGNSAALALAFAVTRAVLLVGVEVDGRVVAGERVSAAWSACWS